MRDIFQRTFSVVKETSKLSLERLDPKKKYLQNFGKFLSDMFGLLFQLLPIKTFPIRGDSSLLLVSIKSLKPQK